MRLRHTALVSVLLLSAACAGAGRENYWNNGSPKAQARYFDNVVVSTLRIGCLQ